MRTLEIDFTPRDPNAKNKRTVQRIVEVDEYTGIYDGSPFRVEVRTINHTRRRYSKSRGAWITVLRSVRDVSLQMTTNIDNNTVSLLIHCVKRAVVQAQVHDVQTGITSTKTMTQVQTTTITQVVQTTTSAQYSLGYNPSLNLEKCVN